MSLDSSRGNQSDCVISYFFQLYLMLHACVRRFDVTSTVQKILRTKQGLNEITAYKYTLHLTTWCVHMYESRRFYQ